MTASTVHTNKSGTDFLDGASLVIDVVKNEVVDFFLSEKQIHKSVASDVNAYDIFWYVGKPHFFASFFSRSPLSPYDRPWAHNAAPASYLYWECFQNKK